MRFAVCLLMLGWSWLAAAQPGELRVALWGTLGESRPVPLVSGVLANGGLGAFNEALAREICRRINARCVLESVLFGEILPGVEARRFDLGFGNFLRTPEREKRVAFSDPIWSSSSRLLGRSDRLRRLAERFGPGFGIEQLRDLRVGAVAGTQQFAYLAGIAAERELSLTGVASIGEALALLRDGKADVCLLPMLSVYDQLRREEPGSYEFTGPPLIGNGLGGSVRVALPRDNEPFRSAVNRAIAALRADGTYHRLQRTYFPFSVE